MTARKRLRILWAAMTQTWFEKSCAECAATSWHVGPDRGLIYICDACESENLSRFFADLERRYKDEYQKGRI